ncbi:transposase IS200 like protein [mine drainage metagenome]|uniref:Transposase IS200 like protein n=1 Tax=mine drainage metagenome TaxID=410659 RepID=A0A1J5Q0D7_9ZZZZ
MIYCIESTGNFQLPMVDALKACSRLPGCLEITERYQVKFLEIGKNKDHVHFLVQSVPTCSVTKIARMVKSLMTREIFRRCPQVMKQLWGGEFWTDGFFASTVGKHGDEAMLGK